MKATKKEIEFFFNCQKDFYYQFDENLKNYIFARVSAYFFRNLLSFESAEFLKIENDKKRCKVDYKKLDEYIFGISKFNIKTFAKKIKENWYQIEEKTLSEIEESILYVRSKIYESVFCALTQTGFERYA